MYKTSLLCHHCNRGLLDCRLFCVSNNYFCLKLPFLDQRMPKQVFPVEIEFRKFATIAFTFSKPTEICHTDAGDTARAQDVLAHVGRPSRL